MKVRLKTKESLDNSPHLTKEIYSNYNRYTENTGEYCGFNFSGYDGYNRFGEVTIISNDLPRGNKYTFQIDNGWWITNNHLEEVYEERTN